MPRFPDDYGTPVENVVVLDTDDVVLMSVDGEIRPVEASAFRGNRYTTATTGSAYTATRTIITENFVLTVNANTTITLAGGGIDNELSVWNCIFKMNATGGWTVTVSGVVWVGGTPTFNTTALRSNHCVFVQHGEGTIYGYYGGSAAS